ncbi:MAG: hypothetical protein NZ840_13365 [Anaerolineales bacterium]|nr:hypothetical protein [Anaerolineales bacterium]MDW8163024.1 hypothetical protein [Anaerolineales bacterium]
MQFLSIGLLTAAVGEWQFSVFLRNDPGNFIGSLAFNALYLTLVYLFTRLLLNILRKHPTLIMIYSAVFGLIGLRVKWFHISNSPWGNPQANQAGMFAYWACMVVIPLIFLLEMRLVKSFITRYALVYLSLVWLGQLLIVSPSLRFVFRIYTFILGFLGLIVGVFWVGAKRSAPPS